MCAFKYIYVYIHSMRVCVCVAYSSILCYLYTRHIALYACMSTAYYVDALYWWFALRSVHPRKCVSCILYMS